MLVGTPLGMYFDGRSKLGAPASLLDTLAAADSTAALTWSTLLGNLLAILLPLTSGYCAALATGGCSRRKERTLGAGEVAGSDGDGARLTLGALVEHWIGGVQECVEAIVILLLAWSLGAVVHDLHTAEFLSGALGAWLPVALLPAASTLLAMATSFGIGSAWGTMGVLVPLVAPLAWELSAHDLPVLTASLGGVLGGAVFGNVASPLADTAVLSSLVCRCEMLAHVSSQAGYVALTGSLSLLVGALPVGLGLYPPAVGLALAVLALAAAPLVARAAERVGSARRHRHGRLINIIAREET